MKNNTPSFKKRPFNEADLDFAKSHKSINIRLLGKKSQEHNLDRETSF